jgi:hypothetical protein
MPSGALPGVFAPEYCRLLLCRALLDGWVVWDPTPANAQRGDLCVGGVRFALDVDEFGLPLLTQGAVDAIRRVLAE